MQIFNIEQKFIAVFALHQFIKNDIPFHAYSLIELVNMFVLLWTNFNNEQCQELGII